MKHLILILLLAISLSACTFKSNSPIEQSFNPLVERQLLQMLENKEMFRLEACLEKERSQISNGIVLFLEAHLQNAFNQIEQSLQTIDLLFDKYCNSLNDTLLLGIYMLKADNLNKQFQYGASVEAMKTAITNYGHTMDSVTFVSVRNYCNLFEPLRELPPQKMHITTDITIPIRSQYGHIQIQVKSNGKSENFIFDTGANVSVINESCAKRFGIQVLEESSLEVGIESGEKIQSKVGIADSLWIGDLLVENVAFLVIADNIFKHCPGIIGFPIMYQMKEIRIHKYESITVPVNPKKRDLHNLFLNGSNMYVQAVTESDTVLMFLDSGFGISRFSERYFTAQQEKILEKGTLKSYQRQTDNGSINTQYYVLKNMPFQIAGYELTIPSISVISEKIQSSENYDGFLGRDILMNFNTTILNFEDMYLTFEE